MTTLKQIFSEVARYPSADNCQPFEIVEQQSNKYSIVHHSNRAQHILNVSHMASDISLGCLKAYLELAFQKYGYKIDFNLTDRQVENIWAEFSLENQKIVNRLFDEVFNKENICDMKIISSIR